VSQTDQDQYGFYGHSTAQHEVHADSGYLYSNQIGYFTTAAPGMGRHFMDQPAKSYTPPPNFQASYSPNPQIFTYQPPASTPYHLAATSEYPTYSSNSFEETATLSIRENGYGQNSYGQTSVSSSQYDEHGLDFCEQAPQPNAQGFMYTDNSFGPTSQPKSQSATDGYGSYQQLGQDSQPNAQESEDGGDSGEDEGTGPLIE
jgi:hypothetical protein